MSSESVFVGRKFSVERRVVDLPDGRRQPNFELIRHNGAVVILALPTASEVLLVRQYRPAAGEWMLELPAGTLELGEDPAACAVRELEEECGFRAARVEKLCEFYCSPGVSTERMHVYAAQDLTPTQQALEEHEVLTVQRTPLAEAYRLAESGQLRDGKTLATLLLWKAKSGGRS